MRILEGKRSLSCYHNSEQIVNEYVYLPFISGVIERDGDISSGDPLLWHVCFKPRKMFIRIYMHWGEAKGYASVLVLQSW